MEKATNWAFRQRYARSFFFDIKDFSKNCEVMDIKLLVQLLEETFKKVSDIITDNHNGIIDKYIGDCVMAIFR